MRDILNNKILKENTAQWLYNIRTQVKSKVGDSNGVLAISYQIMINKSLVHQWSGIFRGEKRNLCSLHIFQNYEV